MSLHDACLSLCQSTNTAVIIVFVVREVHLDAPVVGALGAAGPLGAVAGRWVGQARLLWVVGIVGGIGFLLNPLTAPGWRLVFEVASTFLASVAIIVLTIAQSSYQQSICPPELRGRMNASVSFLAWGVIPLGSILGGVAGSAFGPRPTLWIAGAGALGSAAWLVCSPLRSLRDLPTRWPGTHAATG